MPDEPWAAPRPAGPVDAVVRLPGSKSITNRALVLAALADGPGRVVRPLDSRDTRLMAAGLTALGVPVATGAEEWTVAGRRPPLRPLAGSVDVGNAGTVARFLPPVATLADRPVRFDGDPRMRARPLGPLVEALRRLGARIASGPGGALPLTVHGAGRLAGGAVEVDASASSQLVSGLLLAAPAFDAGVTVRHAGPPVPSAPHLRMTVEMLRAAGARVDDSVPDVWTVEPGSLRAGTVVVEPDLSSAAPFLAAALVTGGRVRVPDWPASTTQPGGLLPGLLTAFGAQVTTDDSGLTVTGGGPIRGADLDLAAAGELTPVLAALAALATGPSRLSGVAHLRGHETDRLAALATELGRLGAEVTETPDGLVIRPRPLTGTLVRTYDDHRLAMAAAVIGLAVADVAVENVATTAKTLPDFPGRWAELVLTAGVRS